jgi:hypothetical protein
MVMHISNDNWLNFKLAERAVDRIPGADLISEESPVAHYGVFSIINHRKNDPKFIAFMQDVDRLNSAQHYVDKNYRVPGIATNIDPKKSFWKEAVTYPYPVKYADVKDGNGTTWQIGYMDEYAGDKPDPQVLVVRRHVWQHHAICPALGLPRHYARPAALRHVGAGQSRQEPGAHHAGHARRRA